MEYTKEDCKIDTIDHVGEVGDTIYEFIRHLMVRSVTHDESKLKEPELSLFTEFTPKLKGSTYGSAEYKGFTKAMKVGLDHHYANNLSFMNATDVSKHSKRCRIVAMFVVILSLRFVQTLLK